MKKWACLFAFALFSISALRAAPTEADPVRAVIESVVTVLNGQRDAWNRGDLKGFMDGYWNSDSVTFVSGGTIWQGWDKVYRRYVRTYGKDKSKMGHLDFSRIVVIPLGDKAALAYGRWDLKMAEGKKLGGMFSLVFRKFSDGWKIIHDHTSRDNVPASASKK